MFINLVFIKKKVCRWRGRGGEMPEMDLRGGGKRKEEEWGWRRGSRKNRVGLMFGWLKTRFFWGNIRSWKRITYRDIIYILTNCIITHMQGKQGKNKQNKIFDVVHRRTNNWAKKQDEDQIGQNRRIQIEMLLHQICGKSWLRRKLPLHQIWEKLAYDSWKNISRLSKHAYIW